MRRKIILISKHTKTQVCGWWLYIRFFHIKSSENRSELAIILIIKEFLDFSRRPNDLSVDLTATCACVVSRVGVDRRVDLSVQLAHVISVKDCYLVSFFSAFWEVFVIARRSILVFGILESREIIQHSSSVSGSPSLIGDRINKSLKQS